MNRRLSQLKTGELWKVLVTQTETAISEGALQPIVNDRIVIPDGGIDFVVRVAANLHLKTKQKHRFKQRQSVASNPFLPPEPALTLGKILRNHIAVLNKFNVVNHHLLIVTDRFVQQEMLLTEEDFEALYWCLCEYDAVGFYNGGTEAGASQRHKHLQLVPYNEVGNDQRLPLEVILPTSQHKKINQFPFVHAFSRLEWSPSIENPRLLAQKASAVYHQLLEAAGIQSIVTKDGERQSEPYNLIVTRNWMLLIPRSREFSSGISINALGYIGSLFIPQPHLLDGIRAIGPIALLTEVSHRQLKDKNTDIP